MSVELVQLHSFYAPPGLLLLARTGDAATGCVGLRALDGAVGEVRRLFVRPAGRSSGIARQLMNRLILEARAARMRRLVLNTLPTMTHALALYASYGFVTTEPYVEEPTDGRGRRIPSRRSGSSTRRSSSRSVAVVARWVSISTGWGMRSALSRQ